MPEIVGHVAAHVDERPLAKLAHRHCLALRHVVVEPSRVDVLAAIEPTVTVAVLNAGGAGVTTFMMAGMLGSASPSWADIPTLFLDVYLALQIAVEDSDPGNFAEQLIEQPFEYSDTPSTPVDVLLQQAIVDKIVPPVCTARLADGAGLWLVDPVREPLPGVPTTPSPASGFLDGRTGAVFQFQPASHEFLLVNKVADQDPDLVLRAQRQAAVFFRTHFDQSSAVVIDPYAADR